MTAPIAFNQGHGTLGLSALQYEPPVTDVDP